MSFTVEQNKQLADLYPYLTPRNVWTGQVVEDYDYSYLVDEDLPEGWSRLFLMYCKELRKYLVDTNCVQTYRFSELKEKYGSMRIYDFGCPSYAKYLSNLYEGYSRHICQRCGEPSTWKTIGWISFYCDNCLKDSDLEKLKFKKSKCMCLSAFKHKKEYMLCYSYKYIDREYKKVQKMSKEEFFNYLIDV